VTAATALAARSLDFLGFGKDDATEVK